jgi:resuscitation-promoting factor RpfB
MSVNDSTLSKGTTRVRNTGTRGVEILTYKVTFLNGIQTHKELIRKVIVTAPVTRVIAVGIKATQQCDPNYSGACVPIASDVDCAGGSGNGPAYVQGPVQVVGTDIYGLDRNGDGIGCEQG